MFPESFTFSIADWVNGWVDSLVTNYGDVFRHISDTCCGPSSTSKACCARRPGG
jgi:ABC-type proline/glycine betaine transport system permease subunit